MVLNEWGFRTPHPKYRMSLYRGDRPQWQLLLAEDDTVDRARIHRVFARFDAVRQHTTYYRSFEDALSKNARYLSAAKIRELDRQGAVMLNRGQWLGAYYRDSTCSHRDNAIQVALIEHVFPAGESSVLGPCRYGSVNLTHPLSKRVANTRTPIIRSSVWPKTRFVAEYLGVGAKHISGWTQPSMGGILGPFLHTSGLVYQLEIYVTHPRECLPLIQAGTWEFYIPKGESSEYWKTEYDSTTEYAQLGKHGPRWDGKIGRVQRNQLCQKIL